jgi:hypothetical protein
MNEDECIESKNNEQHADRNRPNSSENIHF